MPLPVGIKDIILGLVSVNLLLLGQPFLAMAGGRPSGFTFLLPSIFCKPAVKAHQGFFSWVLVTAGLAAEGLEHSLILLDLAEL